MTLLRFPMRTLTAALAATMASLALSGCAGIPLGTPSGPIDDDFSQALATAPATLRPALTMTVQEGPRNAVRNLSDLAVAAMRAGEYAMAERALDAAILRIDSIIPDDANAARAKSKFHNEDVKDFKGEPYERAMVYYYRGLLFAKRGDFQNARAAFLAGGWQAAVTPQERFGKTFGMLSLLGAWASACDGDVVRARDLRAMAEKEDTSLKALPTVATALVLVEHGSGPRKARAGKHGEMLTFAASADAATTLQLAAPRRQSLVRGVDLHKQATSRDGRPIDGILDGKAQFKDTSKAVGEGALAVAQGVLAANVTGDRDLFNIGAAGVLIGGIASILSNVTKPAADTRQLRLLPAAIDLGPVEPGTFAQKIAVTAGTQPVTVRPLVDQGRCQLYWGAHSVPGIEVIGDAADTRHADTRRLPEFRRELAAIIRGERS